MSDEQDQIDAGEKVARVCRHGSTQQTSQLARDWPELARALGKLMREYGTGRPSGW